MNAEAKFVSSVMDARLKKAKRERDAYKKQRDELINDMAETKRKARAFEEIKANLSHVLDLKKHETLDYKDCKVLREIFKETEDELECD
ncbi:hypothetical protein Sazerac_054 [Staphylococcus phage Sazerac]|nr:hypothetical protein Sazerac_054 [Staphylococcus phage Sazerac]